MKTAVSIPDDLFDDVTQAAQEEQTSRSKIFTEAVREYMEKRRNRKLLHALNQAYAKEEAAEEEELRRRSKGYYARKLRKEKW